MTTGVKTKHINPTFLSQVVSKAGKLPGIAIGLPAGKAGSIQYPDGTSVIDVAFWNNYGTKTIPARHFLDVGCISIIHKTSELRAKLLKGILEGNVDIMVAANQLGAIGASTIKLTIRNWDTPPNSEITINGGWITNSSGKKFYVKGKGTNNPLVDTGLLMQSITWEIRE